MITVETCFAIARRRMETLVSDIDFGKLPESRVAKIAELMTFDALMKSGSSISLRWCEPEFQNAHLAGIEELMFDLAEEDPSYVEFYTTKIRNIARLTVSDFVIGAPRGGTIPGPAGWLNLFDDISSGSTFKPFLGTNPHD